MNNNIKRLSRQSMLSVGMMVMFYIITVVALVNIDVIEAVVVETVKMVFETPYK